LKKSSFAPCRIFHGLPISKFSGENPPGPNGLFAPLDVGVNMQVKTIILGAALSVALRHNSQGTLPKTNIRILRTSLGF
jgi:hypothetical protein